MEMNEQRIEEINRKHEMELLDQHFPGKSCGNARCENLCRNVCAAAIRLRMSPQELVDHAIQKKSSRIAPAKKRWSSPTNVPIRKIIPTKENRFPDAGSDTRMETIPRKRMTSWPLRKKLLLFLLGKVLLSKSQKMNRNLHHRQKNYFLEKKIVRENTAILVEDQHFPGLMI